MLASDFITAIEWCDSDAALLADVFLDYRDHIVEMQHTGHRSHDIYFTDGSWVEKHYKQNNESLFIAHEPIRLN